MKSTNPIQIPPKLLTLKANPTQLDPNLELEGPTWPKIRLDWLQIGFIKYVHVWLEHQFGPVFRSTWPNPTLFLTLKVQPDSVEPKSGFPNLVSTPTKWVEFSCTSWTKLFVVESYYFYLTTGFWGKEAWRPTPKWNTRFFFAFSNRTQLWLP